MQGPLRSLLCLMLFAPLAFGCARQDDTALALKAMTLPPASNSSGDALPMQADSAAQAKLAQQYANALATQLNVEREQRRRELMEQKRQALIARRMEEVRKREEAALRREQDKLRREQEARARKTSPATMLLASRPAAQAAVAAPVQSGSVLPDEDFPVFEAAASIALPKPLGTAKRASEPVLFDPEAKLEARKGG